MAFGTRCVETSSLVPLWMLAVGAVIQFILNMLIFSKDRWCSDCCKSGRRRSTFMKFVIVIWSLYQVVKIISIFSIDMYHFYQRSKTLDSWNSYNCYAEILFYSTNLKTLWVNFGCWGEFFWDALDGPLHQTFANVWQFLVYGMSLVFLLCYAPLFITHIFVLNIIYIWCSGIFVCVLFIIW
eukprot:7821_1